MRWKKDRVGLLINSGNDFLKTLKIDVDDIHGVGWQGGIPMRLTGLTMPHARLRLKARSMQ
ncbi:MAG: hypothetical protein J6A87_03605 [Clostridia bacterium]|nr:hypothetical protein [Clostridia bacterium]